MTQDQEIREAVELGKIIQAGNGDMIKQESKDKMVDAFMTLAQRYLSGELTKLGKAELEETSEALRVYRLYLSCSSIMPKPEHDSCDCTFCEREQQVIEACTLALMKKCDGLLKIVLDDVPHQYQERLLKELNSNQ